MPWNQTKIICPGYDTKPTDDQAPALVNIEYLFFAFTSRSTLIHSGGTCWVKWNCLIIYYIWYYFTLN